MCTQKLNVYSGTLIDWNRVCTFEVGAELAVQSQQRRWDDGTRHSQLQPALSSAGTDEWVLSWRLNEASDSSGDRRAVGSRFQVLESYAAKLRWPVDVRVPGTRRTGCNGCGQIFCYISITLQAGDHGSTDDGRFSLDDRSIQ